MTRALLGGAVPTPVRRAILAPLLTRESEPPALVQNEPSCYHFRVLDPRVFAILSVTSDAATIGHCYHLRRLTLEARHDMRVEVQGDGESWSGPSPLRVEDNGVGSQVATVWAENERPGCAPGHWRSER